MNCQGIIILNYIYFSFFLYILFVLAMRGEGVVRGLYKFFVKRYNKKHALHGMMSAFG